MKRTLIIFMSIIIPIIGISNHLILQNKYLKIEDFSKRFLSALEKGDVKIIKSISTEKGFNSLVVGQKKSNYSNWLISLGKQWKGTKMEWEHKSDSEAKLNIGENDETNSIYQSSLLFIKTKNDWKFDTLLSAK